MGHNIRMLMGGLCVPGKGGKSTGVLWNCARMEESPRTEKVILLFSPSSSYRGNFFGLDFAGCTLNSGITPS